MLKLMQILITCGLMGIVGEGYTSPVGVWTTIDENTGEKRADVRFELVGTELVGTIERPYSKPDDVRFCKACPGQFKNKPIQGLQFIWGLKEDKTGAWVDGRILDPQSGRIYRLKLVEKGNRLHVRGYFAHPLIGRTQVWVPANG